MNTALPLPKDLAGVGNDDYDKHLCAPGADISGNSHEKIEVGLLTGGSDRPYVVGLVDALGSHGVALDVIGSDEIDSPEMHVSPVRFLNLRGSLRPDATVFEKMHRVLLYYVRLVRYAFRARPAIFHVLWHNRFLVFDRTLLLLYYRLLGKKLVLTAHNVNAGKRDSSDSLLNRLSLRMQYSLTHRIFVHTDLMKLELHKEFGVRQKKITVIPFGINNTVPRTALTSEGAKQRLSIPNASRTILFFGRIGPYKGLDLLAQAFQRLAASEPDYVLMVVGQPKKGAEKHWEEIDRALKNGPGYDRVIRKIEFVPDEDTELYFKAADVLILPYRQISQSGVLFLAQSFGVPVIASNVGSFRDDVVEGETGFLCQPNDCADLAETIRHYFRSNLFRNLATLRGAIEQRANALHSWSHVADIIRETYAELSADV